MIGLALMGLVALPPVRVDAGPPPRAFDLVAQGKFCWPRGVPFDFEWGRVTARGTFLLPVIWTFSRLGEVVDSKAQVPVPEAWQTEILHVMRQSIFRSRLSPDDLKREGPWASHLALDLGQVMAPSLVGREATWVPNSVLECKDLWVDGRWFVYLQFVVGEDGAVLPDATMAHAVPVGQTAKRGLSLVNAVLDEFIPGAVNQWRFTPGRGPEGQPIRVRMRGWYAIEIRNGIPSVLDAGSTTAREVRLPQVFAGQGNDF